MRACSGLPGNGAGETGVCLRVPSFTIHTFVLAPPFAWEYKCRVRQQMIIFGASGRAGKVLVDTARAAGWETLTPAHEKCDLLQPRAAAGYVLAHPEAKAVVNCAAMASPDVCESDALGAHLVNALSPGEIALACRHTGARFLHLSTDYVLDSRRPGLKAETARCNPCNTYGMSKLEGELQIIEALPESLILRVSWICGNPHRPSFPETVVARALRKEPLAAIVDKFSLPTHARDIATVILACIDKPEESGICHLCAQGEPMSWHDIASVALSCARELGALGESPSITPQHLANVSFFRAQRPIHTAMSSLRLGQILNHSMPTARDTIYRAVKDFLQTTDRREN